MTADEIFAQPFGLLSDVLKARSVERPDHLALAGEATTLTYAELDRLLDRTAAALQREGIARGGVAAVCTATTTVEYAVVYLGTLRAGAAIAPLAASSTPEQLAAMLADCDAGVLFLDASVAEALGPVKDRFRAKWVMLDGSAAGQPFDAWLAPEGAEPKPPGNEPADPFNIIYSSGTTGTPKGIVQSHAMRWGHIQPHYGADAVTMISTPLYSNTTLVSFLPTMSSGGTAVLLPKFDVEKFLTLAERHRATHAMLVPVQYRRIMERPDFDKYDLSSFVMKFSTSAPFSAELKRDVLDRWPGGLVEYYGMTEGGGSCGLQAHLFPDKLHTVGRPLPGHDIRLIGEDGKEVAQGEIGEVVGRSGAMMNGYHNQPGKTSEAEWWSPDGLRFIRTGDVGRFDEDGFLTLMDRKKDMIISGGFNIYPSDLEAVLAEHTAVAEAAVVGVPSDRWGETPVAFVALKPGASASAEELTAFINGKVGKTQRLADLQILEALPRSHIGKVLKRELRDGYQGTAA
ncbi:MAG TPA: class I adenylate-forming enzyme family protein [Phenylobacterium sp.]|nr:class I adenylate-forming enzyme family protein [Phenylobacterium sp.]